jgi:hypothetical protein
LSVRTVTVRLAPDGRGRRTPASSGDLAQAQDQG